VGIQRCSSWIPSWISGRENGEGKWEGRKLKRREKGGLHQVWKQIDTYV